MSTVFQKTRVSEAALLNPSDTTKKINDFPEACVSAFSGELIRKFASRPDTEIIAKLPSTGGSVPVFKTVYLGREVAFYLSRVGGPACAAAFEEVTAMGARCLVLFGSCGILNEEKTRGRLIIPDRAVRDEGTSYHYAEPSDEIEADPESVRILQKIMDNHDIPHTIGKTWTTDALYRETAPAVAERRKEGCLCVEMECASMLAVSRFRWIPFVQFLYGSDSLDSGSWKAKGPDRHGLPLQELYMHLAFECALALCDADGRKDAAKNDGR